jgi:hypothetical protein
MSLEDLPPNLEHSVEMFADRHQLSRDEAIIRLLEGGLEHECSSAKIKGLSGTPMTDDEASVVDEALSLAMEARRQRSDRMSRD